MSLNIFKQNWLKLKYPVYLYKVKLQRLIGEGRSVFVHILLSGGLETLWFSCYNNIILYNKIQSISTDWLRGMFALEYVRWG